MDNPPCSRKCWSGLEAAMRTCLLVTMALVFMAVAPKPKGILLENLTWMEAEQALTAQTVVVIPLGAGSKEHGPHLKLKNDLVMADYLAGRVRDAREVVVAPTVNYSYYPAFAEYPGSTSLRLETAR